MSKKSKKQKTLFYLSLGGKNIAFTKIKLQWIALSVLILSTVVVQALGVYSYAYGYAVCRDKPLEIRGNYYKIPYDEGYGIHAGSDYDRCWGESTMDLQRDPATKAGKIAAAQSAEERDLSVRSLGYALYIPANYIMTELNKSPQTDKKNVNVGYQVTTNSGNKYDIREMNKESDFNYASLCSMPKQKYWYGVVIGKDKYNQPICK